MEGLSHIIELARQTKARENQRFLLTITAAVVIIALGGYGMHFYRSSREQRAQLALGDR